MVLFTELLLSYVFIAIFLSPHCSPALWLSQREAQTHCAGFIPRLRGECLSSCMCFCAREIEYGSDTVPLREKQNMSPSKMQVSFFLACVPEFASIFHTGVYWCAVCVSVCVCVCARTLLNSLIPSLYGEWQPQPFRSAPFGA